MDYMAALSKANFGAHGYAASFVLSGLWRPWSWLPILSFLTPSLPPSHYFLHTLEYSYFYLFLDLEHIDFFFTI